LKAAGAAAAAAALPSTVQAQLQSFAPGQMEAAMRKVLGEAKIRKGKVTLDLPPLVENGNVVPMTVTVDNPMTKDNFVKAIHVFNEKNPQPNVISVQLGARAGKAEVATRIRLATTQKLTAVAELSDGSCWSDTQEVVVTLAACLEDLP
jgi:sulfur-oxidizing protein SoxY